MTEKTTQTPYVVYRPHRRGMPNLRQYFKDTLSMIEFAKEMSDTQTRAANTNTFLGQAWLVINPTLLAGVYWILFTIVGGKVGDMAQLTSGLFLFTFIIGAIQTSTSSITAGGGLILNMPFPKILLPMATTYQSFMRFLPTLPVYLVFHIIYQRPWTWQMLMIPLVFLLAIMTAFGIGMLLATAQVYFRDTAQFLPYFMRIWMYLSPTIWSAAFMKERHPTMYLPMLIGNPAFAVMAGWTDALTGNPWPLVEIGIAAAWAVGLLVVGAIVLISHERDFAIRL